MWFGMELVWLREEVYWTFSNLIMSKSLPSKCDCSASPWELNISKLALEVSESEAFVRSPKDPSPLSILNIIRDEEGMTIFDDCSQLVKVENYSKRIDIYFSLILMLVIPHPMDFKTIERKINANEYVDNQELFWMDLQQIALNVQFLYFKEQIGQNDYPMWKSWVETCRHSWISYKKDSIGYPMLENPLLKHSKISLVIFTNHPIILLHWYNVYNVYNVYNQHSTNNKKNYRICFLKSNSIFGIAKNTLFFHKITILLLLVLNGNASYRTRSVRVPCSRA